MIQIHAQREMVYSKDYVASTMFVILATILLKFTLCFGAAVNGTIQSSESNVCTKPVCFKTAESIMKTMNTSYNPCYNFYHFACDAFVNKEVPKHQFHVEAQGIIQMEVKTLLKDDLERNIKDNDPRTFQLLKSYYNVCLNSRTRKATEEQKAFGLSIFKELGGWPLLEGDSWNETNFHWTTFISKVRELGLIDYTNLIIELKGDDKNVKIAGPIISGIFSAKEWMEMLNVAKYFGAEESLVEEELHFLQDFQEGVANISQIKGRRNKHFHKLSSLIKSHERFSWKKYLIRYLPKNVKINEDTKILVDLKNLDSLLDVIEGTDKRVIANYAFWELAKIFYRVRNASKQGRKIWMYCIQYLMDNMPVATGALYVRKNFNKSWKPGVQEIVNNLIKTYKELLQQTKSVDDKIKIAMSKKLDSMEMHLGYSDELLSDEKIDDHYKNLSNSSGNFLKDFLALMVFNYNDKLKPDSKINHWLERGTVANVDARYRYKTNSLYITASQIHNKYFDPEKPNYLNYAAIGKMIGHEMGHGFDSVGKTHDENGQSSTLWLDKESLERLGNMEKCLIKQSMKYKGVHSISKGIEQDFQIDGKHILDENIADHTGIKLAYNAYEKWVEQNGEEPGLPELPFTSRQLFWLSMAHATCHRISKKGWEKITEDKHPPGLLRVVIPFSNMPEFAKDFNCPAGMRMNPIEKCQFWWSNEQ